MASFQYYVNVSRASSDRMDAANIGMQWGNALRSRFNLTCGPNVDRRDNAVSMILPNRSVIAASCVLTRRDAQAITAEDTAYIDTALFNAMRDSGRFAWSVNGMRAVLPARGTGDGYVSYLGGDIGKIERIVGTATTCNPRDIRGNPIQQQTVAQSTAGNAGTIIPSAANNALNHADDSLKEFLASLKTPLYIGAGVIGLTAVAVIVWKVK